MEQTTYRGITFTDKDVLREMERFDNEFRANFPEKRWVRYAVEYNGRRYPPKRLLQLVTGLSKVGSGGKPVNSRFEDLGFTIVILEDDGPVTVDEGIIEAEGETALSLEYDLENSLIANLQQLEPGLHLYSGSGKTGQQFDTQLVGRIDLLAVDTNGDFVVIELKAEEADRQVCGQIQAYMSWIMEHLAHGKNVRGIIVANDFTTRAVYAAKMVPGLSLKKYQVSFRFTDA